MVTAPSTRLAPAGRVPHVLDLGVLLASGIAVFVVGLAGGAFADHPRLILGVAVWWGLACACALGIAEIGTLSTATRVVGLLLASFALWTLLSAAWSPAEGAYDAFGRVLLFAGVFLTGAILARRFGTSTMSGIAIGIAAIAFLALGSRLLPDVVTGRSFPEAPGWETRLSYPVGYWNGLAILVALSLPLLAGLAARRTTRLVVSGLLLAAPPVYGATIYFASSRGGLAVGAVGLAVFVVCTVGDWRCLVTGLWAAAGLGAGAIVAGSSSRVLADGPLGTDLATSAGHRAAVVIVIVSIASAGGGACALLLSARIAGARKAAKVVLVTVGVVAVAAAIAAHPVQKFDAFKAAPSFTAGTASQHILSATGSGRWQFWGAAIDQFTHHPVLGDGAGTYSAWWAEHGSISLVTHDAHSLYLQTLGELGVVGFVLLVSALGLGAVCVVRVVLAADRAERAAPAAAAAAFLAYLVALGIDWMWAFSVVSVVGMALLGLVMGGVRRPDAWPSSSNWRVAVSSVVAVAATVALMIPLLADVQLRRSERHAASNDYPAAAQAAARASAIEPWASSPYLQLALVADAGGDLSSARTWILQAIDRDPENWELWLVRTRIETRAGQIAQARRSLAKVRRLNPLFAGMQGLG